MPEEIRIVPLGGLGEVGKNMTVFEMGRDAIIVDTGIMFPANDMLGVDYIIPDYQYLLERDDLKVHGVLYTHGHEDHIGAVKHIVEQFPGIHLYATKLAAGLIEVKLREINLIGQAQIHVFESGDTLEVGPWTVESFHVNHSIPGGVGFALNTPYGLIVHTGDYKFDNTPVDGRAPDYAKLASFGERGVKLLMGDSTNAEVPGWTPSEAIISEGFDRVFRDAPGRIVVATFASLISRVQQVVDTCRKYNRYIAFAGHSMKRNVEMAMELGILKVPDNMIIDLGEIDNKPPKKVVVMATGSQGEPSAVLSRMAFGRHRIEVQEGDTIILSAHPIPGNEEMVSRIINDLIRRRANVVYDPIEKVHVSGHGYQEDMKLLMNLVRPQCLMPVHGELRMLMAHKRLAMSNGIAAKDIYVVENGTVIEVNQRGVHVGERVPGGYVFVDGSGVGDVGRAVLRDREILSQDGFVTIVVNVDRKKHKVIGQPEIISRGFVYLREADDLMNKITDVVRGSVQSANGTSPRKLQEKLEDSVSQMLYNETRRRPMVFSVINEN
ncbi:MAG: ribonuclease J [Chloroflexota bacterium]